ncbi:MAG: dTMP kinase [bacterium]
MPFITLEGIDGSGKSTLSNLLQERLRELRIPFIAVREPGGTIVGERIREFLLDPSAKLSPIDEVYLYATSRSALVREVILPSIRSKLIISERYIDSSLAYQGYGKGVPLKFIYEVNRPAIMDIFPVLTVLLDASPEDCFKRLNDRQKDRIELQGLSLQENVRIGYLKLAHLFNERYVVINAMLPPEEILEIALEKIMRYIG